MSIYSQVDKDVMMRDGFTQSVIESGEQPRKWPIRKKNGGQRIIHHPTMKVKLIQYWLLTKFFLKLPQHPSSYAFVKNRSIKDNALRHAQSGNKYFVKVDLKDFFPSIKYSDFERCFNDYRDLIDFPIGNDAELLFMIKESCFLSVSEALPIGFPSSPAIANFVARELDELVISELAKFEKFNPVNTRYADDLIISVSGKNLSKLIIKMISKCTKNCHSNFKVNPDKTKVCSSSGGSMIATGLKICHDQHVTLHKKQKDSIRLKLSLFAKGKLRQEEYNKLSGFIAYAKSIDEQFYTKLNRKFFKQLRTLESLHLL